MSVCVCSPSVHGRTNTRKENWVERFRTDWRTSPKYTPGAALLNEFKNKHNLSTLRATDALSKETLQLRRTGSNASEPIGAHRQNIHQVRRY